MKAKTLSVMLPLFAALAACDSTKPPEYDDVNGTFEGPVTGSDGITTFKGTATFVITQTDGDLSANLTLSGTETIRGITVPWSETYKVTGAIAKGRDPAVSFTLPKQQECPDLPQIELTGKHNSEMRKIELTGEYPFDSLEVCQRLAEVPLTLTVTKK